MVGPVVHIAVVDIGSHSFSRYTELVFAEAHLLIQSSQALCVKAAGANITGLVKAELCASLPGPQSIRAVPWRWVFVWNFCLLLGTCLALLLVDMREPMHEIAEGGVGHRDADAADVAHGLLACRVVRLRWEVSDAL